MSTQKNLLFITQKVDSKDPVLGFVHGWLVEFSKKWGQVNVICLQKGDFSLPSNVNIFSLGKEREYSKFRLLKNFFVLIWRLRTNYDSVFIHMNQEYVLLGGIFWWIFGKNVSLWRNHPKGNFLTSVAVFLSDNVFCTSVFSYTKRFKKTKIMPAGIDTDLFQRSALQRKPNSVLYFGRVSPVKKVEIITESVKKISSFGVDLNLSIYGDPTSDAEKYYKNLKDSISDMVEQGRAKFYGSVTQDEAPKIYNSYEILINTTVTGSFDKVVPEMMACEGLVLTTNSSFKEVGLPSSDILVVDQNVPEDFDKKLRNLLKLSKDEKESLGKKLRNWVVERQSLKKLVTDLSEIV